MENSIQTEINSLIENTPAARMSLWSRIKFRILSWWALRSLPKGQRMLKLGFKAVNMTQLGERFSLSVLNRMPLEKAIQDYCKTRNLKRDAVAIKEVIWYRDIGKAHVDLIMLDDSEHIPLLLVEGIGNGEAVVKIIPLSKYIGDEIPARVMNDIRRAKSYGLSGFHVAYPAMENIPQNDPVVVCKWDGPLGEANSTMLEISWWE